MKKIDASNLYAEAAMMIRRPIEIVFQAFIDPKETTKFWFTKSSGKLEKGKSIKWTWEMFDHSVDVKILDILDKKMIRIQWGENESAIVEWVFKSVDDTKTFVSIKNTGFTGNCDELISQIRDSTGGFTWVLAGMKAYLEHGIELNLISDRYPKFD